MTGFQITAGHHGSCCCGTYIRAGVSKIAAVDVPLPPDPSVCQYSGARQQWYVAGAEGHVRSRRWLHARCAAKLDGLSFDELELLAADRRQELQAKKRQAERTDGRCRPQRRKPKLEAS